MCGFESRRAHVTVPDPRGYPWAEPAVTGVLGPDGTVRQAPYDVGPGRVPLLAVGSNASPTVLLRKLGPLLAAGLPVGTARVTGLGVGHSAHVSAGGYVPAAPFAAPGATEVEVAVAWPDPEQLAALDATEPNYVRVRVDVGCTLPDGCALEGAQVYDSRHGVLGAGEGPLPLTSQDGVLAWLAERLPAWVTPTAATLRAAGLALASGLR